MRRRRSGRRSLLTHAGAYAIKCAVACSAMAGLAPPAAAQGSCNVNREGACVVGGTAAEAIVVTITPVVRLSLPTSAISLGTATPAEFTSGVSTPVELQLSVRANTGWAISLAAIGAVWTASPATAWQSKPTADLGWANSAAGPFTDMGVAPATVQAGGPTAGTVIPLFLRTRYAWASDAPGSYSLPLQITIAAP
jgi:hypothetical protein